jgi:hypothetical protein
MIRSYDAGAAAIVNRRADTQARSLECMRHHT